ncbi:hypothetical protein BKG92_07730 [Rodentibacter ratti]|uniref:DUF3158 domain-containing protein n=1 Tax=Rodentibacter ratti TaxID=1906745 RepID=A0A1V3KWF6_9PAST|nr:DUF3158 family protein [Rodentibacter ratti]OOF82017.1 hypothetical protein BKG92_07730 [Rodentibacter ratti]
MGNVLIPTDMYKQLGRTTPLNDSLKQIFSELESVQQYEFLAESLASVRDVLMLQQNEMLQNVRQSDLGVLPIHMIRDKASSSGGTFLRWRSFQASKTGGSVLTPILENTCLPLELRQKLVSAEKERILINLQISVLNFMMRQVSSTVEKVKDIENTLL